MRRQFAQDKRQAEAFLLTNNGGHKVYSEFTIINAESSATNKVAIRSIDIGGNYCSCADFRTNLLGTCKHIEWTIHKLKNTYGTKKHLAAPPPERMYTSVYVHYGEEPDIRIRYGEDNKDAYRSEDVLPLVVAKREYLVRREKIEALEQDPDSLEKLILSLIHI